MKSVVAILALMCLVFAGLTDGKHPKHLSGNKPPPLGPPPMDNNHHTLDDVIHEANLHDNSEMDLEKLSHAGLTNGNNLLSRLGQMAEYRKKMKGGRKQSHNGGEEAGSGDDDEAMSTESKSNKDAVVKTDEVKELLGDISTMVKDVDMPLDSLKSELVDQVSMIHNAQELSGFLKGVQERYEFPTGEFHDSIMTTKFLISRLTEAGYENDPACLNLQREVKNMVPTSGKLPEDFHGRFLNAYLMSVSCLSLDNALFHNDLAELQELNEGSKRDQVLAALSKIMIGSVRLVKKISEQNRAVEMVRKFLPEAVAPNNTIIYKRLMNNE